MDWYTVKLRYIVFLARVGPSFGLDTVDVSRTSVTSTALRAAADMGGVIVHVVDVVRDSPPFRWRALIDILGQSANVPVGLAGRLLFFVDGAAARTGSN